MSVFITTVTSIYIIFMAILFTKLYNTPPRRTRKIYKTKKKRDESKDFVMDYRMLSMQLFFKTAKGVGSVIYSYLSWMTGMNGRGFYPLPNTWFWSKCRISRQRKSDAVLLLEAADLITVVREKGKSLKVKLNVKVNNGKEK